MKAINLQSTYKLWRSAYWGENVGNKKIIRNLSRYHVFVEQYDGSSTGRPVLINFAANEIYRTADMFINPAKWSNENVSIWEEECD
jgi:hypothetical protein